MMFCTVINCMDGRVQIPVVEYMKKRFNVPFVDVVTEPGPNLILAQQADSQLVDSIFKRVAISVDHHHSVGIAIVGHHDCAGNPSSKDIQISQVKESIQLLCQKYKKIKIIGLWVNENWQVKELSLDT